MANPKRFTFAGSTRHLQNIPEYANYSPKLDIEYDDPDDQYEAYEKDIPSPTPHPDGGTIKWFNAFGIRHKQTKKDTDIQYTVTLQKLPAGKKLYYLHNNKPYEITPEDAGSGKAKYSLGIGDPPNGTYP